MMILSWLTTCAAAVTGYFFYLIYSIRLMMKSKSSEGKPVLVLVFKNAGIIVESVMWDIFRLQSWHNYDFKLLVLNIGFSDDALMILKILQKKYPFPLITVSAGQSFSIIQKLKKRKMRIVVVEATGTESPRMIRRKIVFALNEDKMGRQRTAGNS